MIIMMTVEAVLLLKTSMYYCGCEVWTLCHRFVFARKAVRNISGCTQVVMVIIIMMMNYAPPASPAVIMTIVTAHPLHLKSGLMAQLKYR